MSDPYGIARQGAQANGMLNSLKKEMYQKSLNKMNTKRKESLPLNRNASYMRKQEDRKAYQKSLLKPLPRPNKLPTTGGQKVTNPVIRKPQPYQVGGSQPVTNMPVGKPRPVLPSRPAMEAKKTSAYKETLDQRAKKTMEMMKNSNKRKADLESMKKADYSRVIQKRLAKKNTSKTLKNMVTKKKMVAKKSAKGSYRIGNGPNKASY